MSLDQKLRALLSTPTTPNCTITSEQLTPTQSTSAPSPTYSNLVRLLEDSPLQHILTQNTSTQNSSTQITTQFTPTQSTSARSPAYNNLVRMLEDSPLQNTLTQNTSTQNSSTQITTQFTPTQSTSAQSPAYNNLVRMLEDSPLQNTSTQNTIQFTQEDQEFSTPLSSPTKANPHNVLTHQTPTASALVEAKSSIVVQNCVSTVNLYCQLNLTDINCRTRNSEYNPSRFTGLVMRIRDPRCTALIFKTGKLVCTGARNEADNNLAARKMARILQKLGYNIQFREFKVQNLVATVDLRFPIRLENLHQVHGQFSSYEPELFPGLIYRMIRPRVVLLIFVNGKIVFTGAKLRTDLTDALDNIYPILLSFRKK